MGELNPDIGEQTMVEWPKDITPEVRSAIERVDADKIKSIQVVRDENERVKTITVRREGMITMVEGPGSSDPTYNTTVTYTVEYDGETPSKVHISAKFDGSAGHNAKMDYVKFGAGQAPEDTIEL